MAVLKQHSKIYIYFEVEQLNKKLQRMAPFCVGIIIYAFVSSHGSRCIPHRRHEIKQDTGSVCASKRETYGITMRWSSNSQWTLRAGTSPYRIHRKIDEEDCHHHTQAQVIPKKKKDPKATNYCAGVRVVGDGGSRAFRSGTNTAVRACGRKEPVRASTPLSLLTASPASP